jgi:alpha-mannosidase
MPTYRLFIIPHTHWDREWYEPFQRFRMRLVRLMDKLLDILDRDPNFPYFMLDGQTVVLEDYLEVRPEQETKLRRYIREGRLLVGPWYVLPDEFLVSPEALIRNLLRGIRIASDFGAVMRIGYVPDPFGHIDQLPQILRGFDIDMAVLRRGLADEPTEFWWESPDGTRVLMEYLRDGYDNAAWLPADEDNFVAAIECIRDALAPHAITHNLLLMNGTDHMEPRADLPRLIAAANARLTDSTLIHSTLPQFVEAVRAELDESKLITVRGELRSPKRHHLLPGVLSTRLGIKQRNAACQTLLEKWTEPFAAIATLLNQSANQPTYPPSLEVPALEPPSRFYLRLQHRPRA